MMTKGHKPFTAFVLGLELVACRGEAAEAPAAPARVTSGSAETGPAHSSSPEPLRANEPTKGPFDSLPQDVLVGTDVEKLTDYLAKRAPIKLPSTYSGEQGGATASVQIRQLNGKASMSRTFKEPGAKAQRAEYSALSIEDGGQRLSAPTVEVIGVKDGVIVLEKNSGTDGIPPTLWVFYEHKPKKGK